MPRAKPVVVGITGAGGYLGGALAASLRAMDVTVVEYRRTVTSSEEGDAARPFELCRPLEKGSFKGVTCLVHAAWDLRETNRARSWECNVEGSKRLLSAALDEGVSRFIFVSSMSAYFGTRQDYGLSKLAVERAVLESHQIVVRPGLIYGGSSGGMALTLSKLARLPVIPVFRNARLFTAHVDDVIAALDALVVAKKVPSGVIGLANDTSTSFTSIMNAIANEVGSTSRTVPVPWQPLMLALQSAERVGVKLPVRSDSLLGLVRGAPLVPGLDVASKLELHFRPFPEGLAGTFGHSP